MAPKKRKAQQQPEGAGAAAKRSGREVPTDNGTTDELTTNISDRREAFEQLAGGGAEVDRSDQDDGGFFQDEQQLDEADQRVAAFFQKMITKNNTELEARLRKQISREVQQRAQMPGQQMPAKAKGKPKAKAQTATTTAPNVNPALAAVATASYSNAQEGHRQVYRTLSLLANEARNAMDTGDEASLDHHIKALQALGRITVGAVENVGPQPGYGLNAMLKYISSSLFNCIMTPDTTNYNQATAQAMLEAAKAEHSASGRGGRGGRGGGSPQQQDADKDRERRDDRHDDRRDDRRGGRRAYY
ncbi:hypothetical protein PLESTB_000122200 [Pleodorina starrii]|uniref:Uncharacterized protein n=1 Tax=Pleodorina starrii TaxID=330485 RepID=A0A9W6EXG3_9CHLO|nr:hypothetical protein PLESTB_000122200 [Pleodorina starrii]GLC76337.1 hypothetical protein PLESTF_001768800 [Pleodorina starrii]